MDCKCFNKCHKAQGALWGLTFDSVEKQNNYKTKIISLCVRAVGDPPSLAKPVLIDISAVRKILFRFITMSCKPEFSVKAKKL